MCLPVMFNINSGILIFVGMAYSVWDICMLQTKAHTVCQFTLIAVRACKQEQLVVFTFYHSIKLNDASCKIQFFMS